MTTEKEIDLLKRDIQVIEKRTDKIENRVDDLNLRIAITERDVKQIQDTLADIRQDTKWIIRLVIGAIVLGLLGSIFIL